MVRWLHQSEAAPISACLGEYRVKRLFVTSSVLMGSLFSVTSWANEPTPWQIGLPPPASPTAVMIHDFHDVLLIIITLITIFVLALLLYTCWRFRESKIRRLPRRRTTRIGNRLDGNTGRYFGRDLHSFDEPSLFRG